MLGSVPVATALAALPPDPVGATWLASWTLDPVILIFVVLAGGAYLAGLLRLRRRGEAWPVRRVVAFGGGLVVAVVATMSALGGYAHALFTVYTVQILLLLTIAPLLLAIGRPLGLARAALPERGAARLERVLGSRPARLVTSPILSPLLLAALPFALWFTPWYQDSLTGYGQYELLHLVLLLVGYVVQVPLWETGGAGHGFPYPLLLLFAFIELLVDAVPGIVMRLDTHLLAPAYYLALHRPWGPSPLGDQHLGADVLWCVAEAVDLPFLIVFLVGWWRADQLEAARADRAADAAEAARTAPAGAATEVAAGDPDRPWWERDASVFGDRAGQFRRQN
jgi:putative membrane protein